MACRDGAFVSVDRTWSLVSDPGLVFFVSGTVASSSPAELRIKLRYGGTQACGYGPLSPAPSDFTPGDEIAVQCDEHHQLDELNLLEKPGLVWVEGAGVRHITPDGVMTVAVGGSYDLSSVGLRSTTRKTSLLRGHVLQRSRDPQSSATSRGSAPRARSSRSPTRRSLCASSTADGHDTLEFRHNSVTATSSRIPTAPTVRDVFHVGDYVDVSTNNYGPYPADGVAAVIGFRRTGTDP